MASEHVMDMAWGLELQGMKYDATPQAYSQRLQYSGRVMTRDMGPSWPMALRPGEAPIKPVVLTTPGEWVERGMGNLLFLRG